MRYLPLTADDRAEMLKVIGSKSVDDFYGDVPASARLKGPVPGLPNFQGELEVERHMTKLATAIPCYVSCVTLAQDEDEAGRTATNRLAAALLARVFEVRVLSLAQAP